TGAAYGMVFSGLSRGPGDVASPVDGCIAANEARSLPAEIKTQRHRTMPETRLLPPDASGLTQAAPRLRRGELVAFPTETVYGLGGDATDDHAVAAIFAAKGRPRFNPLIAHLPSVAAVERFAVLTPLARRLAAAFWPGPLTLVLPLKG